MLMMVWFGGVTLGWLTRLVTIWPMRRLIIAADGLGLMSMNLGSVSLMSAGLGTQLFGTCIGFSLPFPGPSLMMMAREAPPQIPSFGALGPSLKNGRLWKPVRDFCYCSGTSQVGGRGLVQVAAHAVGLFFLLGR